MVLLHDEYAKDGKICLDFSDYAKAFVELALKAEESITFGIFGEWGAGKTTLMRSIEKMFIEKNINTVWFNPWEYPPEENMVKAILHTMMNQEWFSEFEAHKPAVIATVRALLKAVTKRIPFVPDSEELLDILDDIQEKKGLKESGFVSLRITFKKLIDKLTEPDKKGNPKILVFFIDDLDRCLPKRIVGILENIRLIFSLQHCMFFIGADRNIIGEGIKYVHMRNIRYMMGPDNESQFDGDRYLEKIIQVPFYIPQNDTEKLGEYFKSFKIDHKDTLFEIIQMIETNPRKIKRIINSIILSWTTYKLPSEKPEDPSDLKVLAILKVIQLQWRTFFKKLERKLDDNANLRLLLMNMTGPYVKGFQPGKQLKDQNEDILAVCRDYNIKDDRFFKFFRKDIVKEILFDPEKLDKLTMYLRSTRGFLQEAPEPETPDSEISTKIELLIEAFGKLDITGFNKLRKEIKNTRLNFSSESFKGFELNNVNFSNCDLLETDFEGCELKNAKFENADLTGSNLSNADCSGANFSKAIMECVNVKNAKLKDAKFDEAEMTFTNWWESKDKGAVQISGAKDVTSIPENKDEITTWKRHFENYHSLTAEEDS